MIRRFPNPFFWLPAGLLAGVLNCATGAEPFWPAAERYSPAVPTLEQVLGYPPGARISSTRQIRDYFEALHAASPERLALRDYGKTWEGRTLFYAVIGSRGNIARLNDIQRQMQALADPAATDAAAAARLIANLPASVWLAYGVHGNEISSPDAALLLAYHLLAAEGDSVVDGILASTLVFIVPSQNPDGRDRFVHHYEISRGLVPDPDRYSAEHDEPWPGGRTNHYQFDLNRDWLALSQPEIAAQVAALNEWYPLIFVDLHEMGSDSTYYFTPEAVPYNPLITARQRENLVLVGRNNARWFDRLGIDYFTREVFDAFYPGYGASWPLYYGALAMTYEQASARGLIVRRADGREMAYAETVRNHFLSSLATAETAGRERRRLLQDFYDYRSKNAGGGDEAYLLDAAPDPAITGRLAALLGRHGIRLSRAGQPFTACGRSFAAGSYKAGLGQPARRLIETLLAPNIEMEAEFIAEQERRRAKRLEHEIYDVTAWSLPQLYGVDAVRCGRIAGADWSPAAIVTEPPAGGLQNEAAKLAWLVPWNYAAAHLLSRALAAGLVIDGSDKAFVHDGRNYPAGTLIVKRAANGSDVATRLTALAAETGAETIGVDHGWVDQGPNFGSEHVHRFTAPRIALAYDEPTAAPGHTRFILEREFGYPVSAIRTATLKSADLDRYQVLILPSTSFFRGDYGTVLGKDGAALLKAWTGRGGTLIFLGNATNFAADPNYGLMALRREKAYREKSEDEKKAAPPAGQTAGKNATQAAEQLQEPLVDGTLIADHDAYLKATLARDVPPDEMPGAIVRAVPDPDHWLAAGARNPLNVLLRGDAIFQPLSLDQGVNAVRFAAADDMLASGYLWSENRRQLAYKPFVAIQPEGRGFYIAFTTDPNDRAYLKGLNILFINAVFRAPAHTAVIH